jgi:hypothetical protein
MIVTITPFPIVRKAMNTMTTPQQALIPVEQAVIHFYNHDIIAVRLPDGRIAASFNDLCDSIQLERRGQLVRVQGDEILSEQLVPAEILTDGGKQASYVLTAWAIPTWLQGVQLSRVAPEKRTAILAFKREAADVLYRHFSQPRQQLTPLVPSEPVQEPIVPEIDAPRDVWRAYHRDMLAWLDWQDDIERFRQRTATHLADHDQQLGELHSRVEGQEEIARMLADAITKLGVQTLSLTHQATVKQLAARLHAASGVAYAAIYSELDNDFHVPRYSDIPDEQWESVVAWFRQRIDAATKH